MDGWWVRGSQRGKRTRGWGRSMEEGCNRVMGERVKWMKGRNRINQAKLRHHKRKRQINSQRIELPMIIGPQQRVKLYQPTLSRLCALFSLENSKTRNNWNSCNTSPITHSNMKCIKTYKAYIHIDTRYAGKTTFLLYLCVYTVDYKKQTLTKPQFSQALSHNL